MRKLVRFIKGSVKVATGLLLLFCVQTSSAGLVTFEGLADGVSVTNQFASLGLAFENATVLSAGLSLNELEFPPRSGGNVVGDDGGRVSISFATPVNDVSAFFTYAEPLSLSFFDSGGAQLGQVTSAFSSNFLSTGNPVNERLGFSSLAGIRTMTVRGALIGGSFVMDDLSFVVIPEPGTAVFGLACALAAGSRCFGRRGSRKRSVSAVL
jgi:hypothetical protein